MLVLPRAAVAIVLVGPVAARQPAADGAPAGARADERPPAACVVLAANEHVARRVAQCARLAAGLADRGVLGGRVGVRV